LLAQLKTDVTGVFPDTIFTCKKNDEGLSKDEVYCEKGKYSFRCKSGFTCSSLIRLNDENCCMLETWEDIIAPILTPFTDDQQNEDDIDSTAYSEPTIKELKEMMNARPLEEGYSVRMAAMVLPLSLTQYYDAFLADDAPSGLDQYLSAVSNTVLKNGTWKKATSLAPEE